MKVGVMDVVHSLEVLDHEAGGEGESNDFCKKCVNLELEIRKKDSEFQLLEDKFRAVVVEKLAIAGEFECLKKRFDEIEKRNDSMVVTVGDKGMERNVDLAEENDEEDQVLKLMIENKVLECEKKSAERQVEVWKMKFREVELRILELEGRDGGHNLTGEIKREPGLTESGEKQMRETTGSKGESLATGSPHLQVEDKLIDNKGTINAAAGGMIAADHRSVEGNGDPQVSDTSSDSLFKQSVHVGRGKTGSLARTELEHGSQVRKQLAFEEGSPGKKMAPSTPGGLRSAVGVIDISDSEGEPDSVIHSMHTSENHGNKNISVPNDSAIGGDLNMKRSSSKTKNREVFLDKSDEEDVDGEKMSSPFIVTPKRKRASNIVTSDTENEDDEVPTCKLKIDMQTASSTDFKSNDGSVLATDSGNKVEVSSSLRRLVSLRNVSTPQRKRDSNIVTSDTESDQDDEDNVPICNLKSLPKLNSDIPLNRCSDPSPTTRDKVEESVKRRRLESMRKFEEKWLHNTSSTINNMNTMEIDSKSQISTLDDTEDADVENESDSEGESLGGFIVDGSDISDGGNSLSMSSDSADGLSRNSDSGDASGDSKNISDDDINYREIMSKIRRTREHKSKWELEADMLSAFAKDDELCMKAVCALYRQQTSDEKCCKGTIYSNQRGFSQCDAYRGTSLAEFLTDGDPKGDLCKTVEELGRYKPKGIALCRQLANHYSKQLFAIYQNKEDPFFLPS